MAGRWTSADQKAFPLSGARLPGVWKPTVLTSTRPKIKTKSNASAKLVMLDNGGDVKRSPLPEMAGPAVRQPRKSSMEGNININPKQEAEEN